MSFFALSQSHLKSYCLKKKATKKPHIFQHETLQGMSSETVSSLIWTAAWKYTSIKKNRKASTTKSLEENKKTAPRTFNIVKLCEAFHRSFLVFIQLRSLQWCHSVHQDNHHPPSPNEVTRTLQKNYASVGFVQRHSATPSVFFKSFKQQGQKNKPASGYYSFLSQQTGGEELMF